MNEYKTYDSQGKMLTSLFLNLLFGRLALANFDDGTFMSASF